VTVPEVHIKDAVDDHEAVAGEQTDTFILVFLHGGEPDVEGGPPLLKGRDLQDGTRQTLLSVEQRVVELETSHHIYHLVDSAIVLWLDLLDYRCNEAM